MGPRAGVTLEHVGPAGSREIFIRHHPFRAPHHTSNGFQLTALLIALAYDKGGQVRGGLNVVQYVT